MKMKLGRLFLIFGVLICILALFACNQGEIESSEGGETTTGSKTSAVTEPIDSDGEKTETSARVETETVTETTAKTEISEVITDTVLSEEPSAEKVESATFPHETTDVISEESLGETTEETTEEIETAEGELVIGTYYLPYMTKYRPISLTFDENGNYSHNYKNEEENERGRYDIVDGKIILEAEDGSRFYKYRIYGNRIVLEGFVYDKEKLDGNLWHYETPTVLFLPGVSESDIISATVMEYNGLDTPPAVEIYGEYDYTNNDAFNGFDHKAYAYMMSEGVGGDPHSDRITSTNYTFTYADERDILVYAEGELLSLDVAYLQKIITEDDLLALLSNHSDCNIAHSYNEGEIVQNLSGVEEILYTCTLCGAEKTVGMPEDFAFTMTFGFDGYYNSETGHMENGYNYTLNTECETTMLLTRSELIDIYRLFYNGELFDITESFDASDILVEPSYLIVISYKADGKEISFKIDGASEGTYRDWEVHPEFGYAYEKVVEDYILSSEEYNSMPPNENAYD